MLFTSLQCFWQHFYFSNFTVFVSSSDRTHSRTQVAFAVVAVVRGRHAPLLAPSSFFGNDACKPARSPQQPAPAQLAAVVEEAAAASSSAAAPFELSIKGLRASHVYFSRRRKRVRRGGGAWGRGRRFCHLAKKERRKKKEGSCS